MQASVTSGETQATLNNVVRRLSLSRRELMTLVSSQPSREAWIGGFVLRSISSYTWMKMVIAQCSTLKYL